MWPPLLNGIKSPLFKLIIDYFTHGLMILLPVAAAVLPQFGPPILVSQAKIGLLWRRNAWAPSSATSIMPQELG